MSKCCCDLFKIHKKKVIASLRVITKFFYCVTPMSHSKREETTCPVPKENHANASGSAS